MAVDENRIRYSIYKSFKDNKAFNYSKKYVIDEIVPAATNAIQYIKSFGVTPDRISIPEVSARLEQDHKDYIEKSSYTMEEMQALLKYFAAAYKDYEESKQDRDRLYRHAEQVPRKVRRAAVQTRADRRDAGHEQGWRPRLQGGWRRTYFS